jgi:RNA polymerase-binding transcription factor
MRVLSAERQPLQQIKSRLEDSRQRLLVSAKKAATEDERVETEDLSDTMDTAASEQATSLRLRLHDRDGLLLRKIERALERFANGSVTTCDRCGQEIPLSRLEARPMTTLCLDCKEEEESEERRYGAR